MSPLLLTSGLILLVVGCQESRTPNAPPSPQPEQASREALGALQKIVTAQNFKAMGFDSLDEVKQAQLGAPLGVFNIGLEQVKGYREGTNADSLLTKSSETVYPVAVSGQVKSSVTIVQKENGYVPSSFGNADVVKRLARYRQGAGAAEDFIVRVPALNMFFLGRRAENRLVLIPIVDDPRVKLQVGEAVPAEAVLAQLVSIANAYNGLPM